MKNRELFSNNNISEQVDERQALKLRRHERKLMGYLLSGGDTDYIFNSEMSEFSEKHLSRKDQEMALNLVKDYPKLCERLEHQLLEGIVSFPDGRSNNEIVAGMDGDKHQKRILNYMLERDWDNLDGLSGKEMGEFLKTYPTPMDFETDAKLFLKVIKKYNSEEKYQEYVGSMEDFCETVYGKKYEYYIAMRSLEEKANGEKNSDLDGERQKMWKIGQGKKTLEAFGRAKGVKAENAVTGENLRSPEKLVVDAGALTLNKGVLIGDRTRENEDAAYYNPEAGLFAVFDGAGGINGGARASEIALSALSRMSEERMPETVMDLKRIAEKISDTISRDEQAGITTGVFGKIIEDEDGKRLAYVSVGDSRIYVVRGQKLMQITQDEGHENGIDNWLGKKWHGVGKNCRDFPLMKGDRIVFCSDGVTGDFAEDFIPDEEFIRIVNGAETAKDAAKGLIKRATKTDDRTAIVVEV